MAKQSDCVQPGHRDFLDEVYYCADCLEENRLVGGAFRQARARARETTGAGLSTPLRIGEFVVQVVVKREP